MRRSKRDSIVPRTSSVLRSKCIGAETCAHIRVHARKRKSCSHRARWFLLLLFLLTKKWHGKEMLHVKPRLRRCRETSTADFFFFHHTSCLRYGSHIGLFYRRIKVCHFNQQFLRYCSLKFHSTNMTHLLNFKLY